MKISERLWTRMNGAGNSFFATDAREMTLTESWGERSAFARRLCSQTPGLSADGLFVLETTPDADFQWDFFNSDGSAAEMCGNAARCATRFFLDRVRQQDKVRFKTVAGVITGEKVGDGQYRVQMPGLPSPGALRTLTVYGTEGEYYFVNTGVPHLVIEHDPVSRVALDLRQASELGPAGSNVTFVKSIGEGHWTAVTFERGVDDFTLACGTGAVAAAAFARLKSPQLKIFQIQMPGGMLSVDWTSDVRAELTGPAKIDYELKLGEDT